MKFAKEKMKKDYGESFPAVIKRGASDDKIAE